MENNSSFPAQDCSGSSDPFIFVLQCSVFNSLAMGGIIPNLMIILTSSFGFMRRGEGGTADRIFLRFYDIFSEVSRDFMPWS